MRTEDKHRLLVLTDIISAISGIIGVILGASSIIVLIPSIEDTNSSFYLTVATIIFDSISAFTAMLAFSIGVNIDKIKEKYQLNAVKSEKTANRLDLSSFCIGIGGLIFGWLSLVALMSFWQNDFVSIWATIVSVLLDIGSFSLVTIAVILTTNDFRKKHKTNKHYFKTHSKKMGIKISN